MGLASTDVIWVSIPGAAPSLQELLAGGIDIVSCSLAEAQALLDSGRIRTLGVMADARLAQFAEVPTFREQGIEWTLGTIRGLAVPKDTPPDRVRVLSAAVKRVVESDAYQSTMIAAGFTPAYQDPTEFGVTLERTDERLGALLSSAAFRGFESVRFGPMFFPGLLMGALALVSGALLCSRLKSGVTPDVRRGPPTAPPGSAWRFAEVLLWIALYVACAETLGFLVTASALLLAYLLRLGTRLAVAAPLTLIVPIVYYVFGVVLRVPLPRGVLGW